MPRILYRSSQGPKGTNLLYDTDTMKTYTERELMDAEAQQRQAETSYTEPEQQDQTIFEQAYNMASNAVTAIGLDNLYNAFTDSSPERNAKILKAAQEVSENPQGILIANKETQDKALKLDNDNQNRPDWNSLIRNNPQTAMLLNDRGVMATSFDDINILQSLEDIGNVIKNSYEYAQKNRELGEIGAKMQEEKRTLADLTDEERQRMKAIQSRMRDLSKQLPESVLSPSGLISGIMSFAPQAIAAAKGAAVGAATGAVAGSVLPGIGTAAGGTIGAVASAGATFGMANDYGRQQQGIAYLRALAQGADRSKASAGATESYVVNSLLSIPMVGRALRIPVMRGGEGLLRRIAADVVEQSSIGMGMASADILANKIAHGKATSWNINDASQIVEEGAMQVPVALAFGAPSLGIGMVRALGRQADLSKTKERNPDIVAQHIDNVLQGSPAETMQFDATGIVDTLNTLNDTEAQQTVARLKLNMNDVSSEVASGGEVSVRTSDFLVLPENIREQLIEQARIDGDPSVADLQNMDGMNDNTPLAYMDELSGNDEYAKLARDAEQLEEVTKGQEQAVNEVVNEQIPEIRQAVEESPLYRAEDAFSLNLQLFGKKTAKEIAKDFRNDSLTDEQMAMFERIAEENGFSSADEMAKKILENRTKQEEIKHRTEQARENARTTYGITDEERSIRGQLNDDQIKKSAMESAAIADEGVNGTRADAVKEIDDAINELDVPEELDLKAPELQRMFSAIYKSSSGKSGDSAKAKERVNKEIQKWKDKVKEARQKGWERVYQNRTEYFQKGYDTAASYYEPQLSGAERRMERMQERIDDIKAESSENLKRGREEGFQKGYDRAATNYERKLNSLDKQLDTVKDRLHNYIDLWYGKDSRVARRGSFTANEAKRVAKDLLMTEPIEKSSDYRKYLQQARAARLRSDMYYRKKDFTNALKWKNKEIVSYAMGQEAVKIKDTATKYQRFLNKIGNAGKKSFKTEEDLLQAGRIMSRFGFSMKDMGNYTNAETLNAWSTRTSRVTPNVSIAEWLYDETVSVPYTSLTVDQLKDVRDAVANIRKVSNSVDKIQSGIYKGEITDLANDFRQELNVFHKPKFTAAELSRKQNRVKRVVNNLGAEAAKLETTIMRVAGEDSKLFNFWISGTNRQNNKRNKLISEYANKEQKIWDRYTAKEKNSFAKKMIYVEEMGTNVTKQEMFAIAMNLGTETNRAKLFSTRPSIFQDAKVYDEASVMNMLQENFTEKDWETVQMRWDLLNELWPLISKFEKEHSGYTPEKVESTPFMVSVGDGRIINMRGGYFPLAKDYTASGATANAAEKETALYNNTTGFMRAQTRNGFTKQRTNAEYAVSLDEDILSRHVVDVATDLYFRDLVCDMNNIMNNQEFRTELQRHVGGGGVGNFEDHIRTISDNPYARTALKGVAEMARGARRKIGTAAIAFNLGVQTQNFANIILYPNAVKGFGYLDTVYGIMRYGLCYYWPRSIMNWRSEYGIRQQIYEQSQFMADRAAMPDQIFRELSEGLSRGQYENTLSGRINKLSQSLMLAFDDVTAVPMWLAARDKALGRGESMEAAVEYADTLIRRVNGSGRQTDLSRMVRANSNEVVTVFTQFYSFFNTELNRWMVEMGLAKQRGIAGIPRMAGFLTTRVLLFPLISNLLAGKLPDDDDDPMAWFFANAASYPFQLLPGVKDVVPTAINAAFGLDTYSYRAGGPVNFIAQTVDVSRRVMTTLNKEFSEPTDSNGRPVRRRRETKQDQYRVQNTAEAVMKYCLMLKGVPNVLNNMFWNAYDYSINNMEPQMSDIFRRRPVKERDYMEGDARRRDRNRSNDQ